MVLPSAQPSGRPSLSHVGGIIIGPYAFGATKMATFQGAVFKSAFVPFLQCKNAHPEITPNLSGLGLRFNISLCSIDPCPPFRAKRTDKAPDN